MKKVFSTDFIFGFDSDFFDFTGTRHINLLKKVLFEVIRLKKLIILVTFLVLLHIVSAEIIIKEVLYDPIDSETTGEAILLYNDGSSSIDVSEWILSTESSATDVTIPTSTVIAPEGYLLIADIGFSLNKYNPSWPDADYEEPITLANTDAGLALKNGDIIIDAVGWGNLNAINIRLFEGNPHTGSGEGNSLRRTNDTNDNSVDFYTTTPLFYQSQNPSIGLEFFLDVVVNITSPMQILRIEILEDDNSSTEGIQIKPILNESRLFEIKVELSHENNVNEIDYVKAVIGNKKFTMSSAEENGTSLFYRVNVSMDYYDEPGLYDLEIEVMDGGEVKSDYKTFEYLESAGMTMTGAIQIKMPAGNTSVETITFKNVGNKDLDLKMKGNNLLSDINMIDLEHIIVGNTQLTNNYQHITNLEKGPNSELNIDVSISSEKNLPVGS